MTDDGRDVLRAVAELTSGQIQLVEYSDLATHMGWPEGRVRIAAGQLRTRGLCQATFGGLQLATAGLVVAYED